jgi:ferredoxin
VRLDHEAFRSETETFRSRLLLWAPLVLALYMFVWPTFKRVALLPLLERFLPGAVSHFTPPPPFPGLTSHLTTEHFWATMPGLAVAMPFLLICGFVTVYLMGAKAYCSYGCPYGGFFAPVDRFAPGRIRVTDACRQCGHCTVSCSSNVRVHEEVREYGMVVDPGCMKCLDCVNVCPKGALYFGFGPPAAAKPSPRTGTFFRAYDLPLSEEIVLAAVFALSFFALRGVYDVIPVLMAMGMAGCTAYLAWIGGRLLRMPDVALQNVTLRAEGRLTGAGRVTAVGVAVVGLLVAHSALVNAHRTRAERWDREVRVPVSEAFRKHRAPLDPVDRERAQAAARHYRRADRIDRGGFGLLATPEMTLRRAWLALVLGEIDEAEAHLRHRIAAGGEVAPMRVDLARTLRLAGKDAGAERELRDLIALDPADPAPQRELAALLESRGDLEGAVAALVVVHHLAPEDRGSRERLIYLLLRLGRPREAARYRD